MPRDAAESKQSSTPHGRPARGWHYRRLTARTTGYCGPRLATLPESWSHAPHPGFELSRLARLTAPDAAAGRVHVTAGGKSLALIIGKAEWSRAITTDQNGISRSQD